MPEFTVFDRTEDNLPIPITVTLNDLYFDETGEPLQSIEKIMYGNIQMSMDEIKQRDPDGWDAIEREIDNYKP